ncbi:DUF5723 family protein [Bacteroidota bacterium]
MINIKTKISIALISTVLFINMNAQDNNGMYFMSMIPQTNYLNPAIIPECNFYLGAPMLSSTYFEFNSALSFNNIIYKDTESDSVVLFLATKEYQDKFIKKLDKAKNLFGTEIHITIGSFGFKAGNLYFNFAATTKMIGNMNLPADFLDFILNGNYIPDPTGVTQGSYLNYDLSNFDINLTAYTDLSAGVSYELTDQITVGVRPKLVFGLANLSSSDQVASLNSSSSALSFDANFTVNSNVPGLTYDEAEDSLYMDGDAATSQIMGNMGFGLDIGGTYKYDEKITAYASIVDLGWINWKSNPNSLYFTAKYDFQGIDVSDMLNKDEDDQQQNEADTGNAILDSLKESFDITNTSLSYRTGLGTKIYLGGTYAIHEKIDLGVLSRSQIYRGKFRQQLTLSANFKPLNFLHATVSYTMKNRTFNNLGYGLSYRFGPLNSYVIIDKSLAFGLLARDELIMEEGGSAIPLPHNFSKYTIRFGANLMFGGKDKKDKKFDKPIVD